ncbi:hypothetical protein N7493_007935 [Penicillium malachiteum]|uniref:Uncharacterized protein n=1 Tax=Penicillium malachiteum TaxID=1324776 RepID=A0AAD6HIQ6_9EURO|nr:hypothetical protein N7493_007935 [Penicillium malachiteum]
MSPLRDEELGKKSDDHHSTVGSQHPRSVRSYYRMLRPRRFLLALVALVAIFEFFKHMPTDLKPARERYYPTTTRIQQSSPPPPPSSGQPPVAPQVEVLLQPEAQSSESQDGSAYDGKIKLYELANSLPSTKHPENEVSRAVLFAGSNLQGIADMLPLACLMAREKLNAVHFAILGKEEVSVEGIKQVNGIMDSECPMVWHDSRPNYAAQSADSRMEKSVSGGLRFIRTYIAPEVIITKGKDLENSFFWNGLERHIMEAHSSHISLPSTSRDIMWLASIDSSALKGWNNINVDMVVHASHSSGSIARLIRSLDAADYLGSTPKLTIELPPEVDPQTLEYLKRLDGISQLRDKITLRRRVQPGFMDSVESSLQTVESFYPLDPKTSHLLMLSPHTELAPAFYHYLKYAILTYKNSARNPEMTSKLFGISLELPSLKPGIKDETFFPPTMDTEKSASHPGFIPTFLWQAPASDAVLYFGEKWVEFHEFLSNRLETSKTNGNIRSQDKLVSQRYPAFMEYMLELMRANGYYMAYPSFPGIKASSLVTVHNDLYESPDEFSSDGNDEVEIEMVAPEKSFSSASTISTLFNSFEGGLPNIETLPLLSFDGKEMTKDSLVEQTKVFLQKFRTQHGGCPNDQEEMESPSDALFCI